MAGLKKIVPVYMAILSNDVPVHTRKQFRVARFQHDQADSDGVPDRKLEKQSAKKRNIPRQGCLKSANILDITRQSHPLAGSNTRKIDAEISV